MKIMVCFCKCQIFTQTIYNFSVSTDNFMIIFQHFLFYILTLYILIKLISSLLFIMQEQKRFEFPLINSNQLLCRFQHLANQVCLTENCKQYAFICQNRDCQCQKQHNNCKVQKSLDILSIIEKQRKVISPAQEQLIEKIRQEYDTLLDTISKCREQFQQLIDNFGICGPAHQVVKKFVKGHHSQITGHNFYEIKIESQEKQIIPKYEQFFLDTQLKVNDKIFKLWEQYNSLFLKVTNTKSFQKSLQQLTGKKTEFNFDGLRKVTQIDIFSQDFNKVPIQVKYLTNLNQLCLGNCQIQKIQNLNTLKKLKVLNLAGNKIKKIAKVQGLGNLEKLFLQTNSIEKIQNLSTLQHLNQINLGNNKIKKLQNLRMLKNLKLLRLYDNKIGLNSQEQLQQLLILNSQQTKIYIIDYSNAYSVKNQKNSPSLTEELKNKFKKWPFD